MGYHRRSLGNLIWTAGVLFLLQACATYAPKYAGPGPALPSLPDKEISHTFYLIGDAGTSPLDSLNPALLRFRDRLAGADANSTALFLGDNIYPAGLPDPEEEPGKYREAKSHLDAQLKTLDAFPGRPIFIPGNHDWYNNGLEGLKRQEKYIEDALDRKDVFLPEDGCPMVVEEYSEELILIAIDTEWYLTNWDRQPSINDDCRIKSRGLFLSELESEIKKHANKTIILAAHHPMFSYGEHGGQYTFRQQFYPYKGSVPLPILGSLINMYRTVSGVSTEDLYNKRYRQLRQRLATIARFGERVLITSGHEHTLQYNVEDGVIQAVSGAGAKKGATRLRKGSRFSTGMRGYAILEVYTDGSSAIEYYGVSDDTSEERLFATEVHPPEFQPDTSAFQRDFPPRLQASIYTAEEVDKSGLHRKLWGERYRKYYGMPIDAPIVEIDTLYGGLEPVRKGGGQQSKSLRLRHSSGKEYVMRALRKQAEQNLQAMVFQNQYIMGQLENTAPENLLEDIYTGAHPYAPFALDTMMDSLGILHTNPRIFYVPKQAALGRYNEDFGDELYMIEEHPSEGHEDLASFGYAQDIESTMDLLDNLRDDERYKVDTPAYIRARLFDMLVGDWDRHQDQWRWAEFDLEDTDSVLYKPIPRDRDQVFSKLGDGWIGGLLTFMIPDVKKMEGFREEIRNVRTFNTNPYPLDLVLLSRSTLDQWLEEARVIRRRVTPGLIDRSFERFPLEVRDETVDGIKSILLKRLERLEETARAYYKELQRYALIQGTDKDDWFFIESAEGGVRVRAYRILGGEAEKKFFDKTFDPALTREIWIYGLDDPDRFEIDLPESSRIRVRVVGGLGKDRYTVQSGKRAVIYDFKNRPSRIEGPGKARTVFTNDYQINTYQPLQAASFSSQLTPDIGFNPDDGLRLGAGYTYTQYGFRKNPFTSQHAFRAGFFFATSGIDLRYTGEFANIFKKWNLQLGLRFTSPNFTRNFFGFGNETPNFDDALGLDYNRVRIQIFSATPSLVWRGPLGGEFRLGAGYEYITVEETDDRFVNTFYLLSGAESTADFLGVFGHYRYSNQNSPAFPSLGMSTDLEFGFKKQLLNPDRSFGYVIPSLSLNYPLALDGDLTLALKWKAHFNLGNGYEFYQGAQIGASDGPRSFRNQRFTGKTSYYQLTDVRWQFARKRTGIMPVTFGIFGGFDYGRVWQPEVSSGRWHNSYGGGFFANGLDLINANLGLFHGAEGFRLSAGLGFTF